MPRNSLLSDRVRAVKSDSKLNAVGKVPLLMPPLLPLRAMRVTRPEEQPSAGVDGHEAFTSKRHIVLLLQPEKEPFRRKKKKKKKNNLPVTEGCEHVHESAVLDRKERHFVALRKNSNEDNTSGSRQQ